MGENIISWSFTGTLGGTARVTVHFVQDSTGSRTLAGAEGHIRFALITAPILTTAAGKRDVFQFPVGADNYGGHIEVSRTMNVTAGQ